MSTQDPEFYQTPKFSPEAPPRQRGCFFYGCIIASVLALLVLILVGILFFVGYRMLNQAVEKYTATAPEKLPAVEMPAGERQALKDRVETFRKAVDQGTASETLVLSSDDLNALIEESPQWKGKVYVRVEGDQVKGRVSIPLDPLNLPLPMLKGRYLNGEADLKASMFDGELIVHLDGFEVNGVKPSEQFMTELRKQNFAKDATKDKDLAATLRKIESLEIKDGKITLKVRAKPAGASSGASKAPIPIEIVPSGNGQPKTAEPPKNGQPKATAEPAPAEKPAPKP